MVAVWCLWARIRAVNFLDGLIMTAYEDPIMFDHPENTDMTYAKYARNIPFAFKKGCGLKVLLAFTDSENDHWSRELYRLPEIQLSNLGPEALYNLVDYLIELYQKAHKVNLHDHRGELQDSLLEDKVATRLHIKSLVEQLDIRRYQTSLNGL